MDNWLANYTPGFCDFESDPGPTQDEIDRNRRENPYVREREARESLEGCVYDLLPAAKQLLWCIDRGIGVQAGVDGLREAVEKCNPHLAAINLARSEQEGSSHYGRS